MSPFHITKDGQVGVLIAETTIKTGVLGNLPSLNKKSRSLYW
jgi:hypothetical protein